MKLKKANKVMKYLIAILLLILLILIIVYKTDDCAKCRFKWGNMVLKFKGFMGLYAGECFKDAFEQQGLNVSGFGNRTKPCLECGVV